MKTLKTNIYIFIFYFFVWLIEFYIIFPFQKHLFNTKSLLFPALVYLPHGVRVLTAMVYGIKAIPGLLTAHIITGYFYINSINDIIILSLLSIFSVYCAFYLVFRNLITDEKNIYLKSIIIVTIISSIFNSLTNVIYKSDQLNAYNIIAYTFGDFFGTIILYMFIRFLLKKYSNYVQK